MIEPRPLEWHDRARLEIGEDLWSQSPRPELARVEATALMLAHQIFFLMHAAARRVVIGASLQKIAAGDDLHQRLDSLSLWTLPSLGLRVSDACLRPLILDALQQPPGPLDLLGAAHERALTAPLEVTPGGQLSLGGPAHQRRRRGAFYTPRCVVEHIIERVKVHLSSTQKRPLQALDPSCGAGHFLLGMWRAYPRPSSLIEKIHALSTTLWGVDVDPRAIIVCRRRLLLEVIGVAPAPTPPPRSLLDALAQNICIGDALRGPATTTDSEDAWEHFCWSRSFEGVKKTGGFDLVFGNPPYLKEPGHEDAFRWKKDHLRALYRGKMDLWYAFAGLALLLLREGGVHSFIATSAWVTSSGAAVLRSQLRESAQLLEVYDFSDAKVFPDAAIQTMIYTAVKKKPPARYSLSYYALKKKIAADQIEHFLTTSREVGPDKFSTRHAVAFQAEVRADERSGPLHFTPRDIDALLDRIKKHAPLRLSSPLMTQGVVPNPERLTRRHLSSLSTREEKGEGVFVLSEEKVDALALSPRERSFVRPYHTHVARYRLPETAQRLLYLTRRGSETLDDMPNIEGHLRRFKPVMEARRETKNGRIPWFALHWPRHPRFFEGPAIVSLRKTPRPCFCSTPGGHMFSLATNLILPPEGLDILSLLAILNSDVVAFWLQHRGKKQGSQLQVDTAPLQRIPLPTLSMTERAELSRRADEMQRLMLRRDAPEAAQKIDALDAEINRLTHAAYQLRPRDVSALRRAMNAHQK